MTIWHKHKLRPTSFARFWKRNCRFAVLLSVSARLTGAPGNCSCYKNCKSAVFKTGKWRGPKSINFWLANKERTKLWRGPYFFKPVRSYHYKINIICYFCLICKYLAAHFYNRGLWHPPDFENRGASTFWYILVNTLLHS